MNSFDELPAYVPGTLERDADLADFAFRYESELLEFYRDSLREMGFRGIFSNYNTFPNKHYLRLRRSLDCVTKNSYEMLMTRYNRPGSSILQTSSIERCSAMLRGSLAARLAGKPFVITEYGIPFWNRYRYEQPFTMGAYASFQDFDGLAAFGDSVALTPVRVINPVRIYTDPVGVANEMLTFFLFQRGDVAAAPGGVTILCREETLVGPEGDRGGPTREEGLLGLLTREGRPGSPSCTPPPARGPPGAAIRSACSGSTGFCRAAIPGTACGNSSPPPANSCSMPDSISCGSRRPVFRGSARKAAHG